MQSKFFFVVIVSLCSQVAMTDKFEVVSNNTSKYRVGSRLTEKSNIKLGKGEPFSLKTLKSLVVLTGGDGKCKCKPNDLSCTAKCIATSLSCVPSVFWGKYLSFLRN